MAESIRCSLVLELRVVNVGLDFRFVEVGRVFDVLPNTLHKRYPDGGVTVAVVTSGDDSHHFLDRDLISLLVDYSSLFDGATAEQTHSVHHWAKGSVSGCISHTADIGDDYVAKVVCTQSHSRNADPKIGDDVRHDETERLSDEGWQEIG